MKFVLPISAPTITVGGGDAAHSCVSTSADLFSNVSDLMHRRHLLPAVAALLLFGSRSVVAQSITVQVDAINAFTITGTPSLHLTSSDVVAGATSTLSHSDASSVTYAYTSNDVGSVSDGAGGFKGKSFVASMPAIGTGFALLVTAQSPGGGGTSAGETEIGTTNTPLVTGIQPVNSTGKTLTYKLTATVAAGTLSSTARTVTFTIIDTP
jgi:hypothetical protein